MFLRVPTSQPVEPMVQSVPTPVVQAVVTPVQEPQVIHSDDENLKKWLERWFILQVLLQCFTV